jgi:hypothetical protein
MKRTGIQRKTAMRQRSRRRQAYMASEQRAEGVAHMLAVKALGCLICGAHPAEAHHLPNPRDDMRTIPLCPFHHRAEYGPQAYHYSRKNFNAAHGSDDDLLNRTLEALRSAGHF